MVDSILPSDDYNMHLDQVNQQDSAPIHVSHDSRKGFSEHGIHLMHWPPHLRGLLLRNVYLTEI